MSESGHHEPEASVGRLRLLSYNIQVGLDTRHYGDYLMGAWRHALPSRGMQTRLDALAAVMTNYDFVALQEADAGSLRTRFRNQVEYLAERAGFAYRGWSVTRDLRPVAQHCLGYLSRFPVSLESDHALPGPLPGRRVLRLRLGTGETLPLTMLLTHMSLGRSTQHRQLEFLAGLVPEGEPTVLMGDLNCEAGLLAEHPALRAAGLVVPDAVEATFPSWRPRRRIDHVLVSPEVQLLRLQTLDVRQSDHLPLSADIRLPWA